VTVHSMRSRLKLGGPLPLLALCVLTSAGMIATASAGAIATDRREADLDVAVADKDADGLPIKNDPPRLLFSEQSAILILVDGNPVYRPVPGTDLQRIINTKPFIVRDTAGIHYMNVFDGWMQAYMLTGIWSVAGVPPHGAEQALQQAVAEKTVDLTSGRWFRAWTTDGPWQLVPSRELPADIAAIPDNSPKASVKASIAGTTQAREALMANAVPQTTTINRHQTELTPPALDGDPQLQRIEGTSRPMTYGLGADLTYEPSSGWRALASAGTQAGSVGRGESHRGGNLWDGAGGASATRGSGPALMRCVCHPAEMMVAKSARGAPCP